MLNFDIRELNFWVRKAQKKLLEDQIKRIQAARIAMADSSDYMKIVSDLDIQLKKVEFGSKVIAEQGWEFLKMKQRR